MCYSSMNLAGSEATLALQFLIFIRSCLFGLSSSTVVSPGLNITCLCASYSPPGGSLLMIYGSLNPSDASAAASFSSSSSTMYFKDIRFFMTYIW